MKLTGITPQDGGQSILRLEPDTVGECRPEFTEKILHNVPLKHIQSVPNKIEILVTVPRIFLNKVVTKLEEGRVQIPSKDLRLACLVSGGLS